MNDISLFYINKSKENWEDAFLNYINTILLKLKIDNWEFSITLCDNGYIKDINHKYRNKNIATDVITFVMSDEPFPGPSDICTVYSAGDIIISLDFVKENAKYFNVNYEEEIKRVLIHGILHLMGYDHKTNNKDEEMLILQEEILEKTKEKGIF